MTDFLYNLDHSILVFINKTCSSPWQDTFFLMITNIHREPLVKWLLIPVLLGVIIKTSGRFWWSRILMIGAGIGISDAISHRIVKAFFERPRPFIDLKVMGAIRTVGEAQGFSFPSNHATNMFLTATLLSLFYRQKYWLFYGFAALIAYSRVYLGVHFPSDVMGGALLGTTVALLVSHFWPFAWRENSKKL